MCGIVGYCGQQQAAPLLLEGLSHLEYRGYDSAGVALIEDGQLELLKAVGRLANLAAVVEQRQPRGKVGIGHTRWATHGRPSDENAHPHTDCTQRICVVHNGVIENYRTLRAELLADGHTFLSDTDTEVLAHLIESELQDSANHPEASGLAQACRRALSRVTGLYAIAVVCTDEPDVIVGARNRAPLIVGLGEDGNFLASDMTAVLSQTRRMLRLREGDVAEVRAAGVRVFDVTGQPVEREPETVDWQLSAAERGGFPHFFLKEVFEQPEALRRTLGGRVVGGHVVLPELDGLDLQRVRRIVLTGCGSSHHAAMMAKYAYESWLRLPVEVDIASELRYRTPAIDGSVLCIALSQSGETADTLAAFELMGSLGAQKLAVTNVVGSAITSVADAVVNQHSGPEVAVVASKTFTGQVAALLLVGLALAPRLGTADPSRLGELTSALEELPDLLEQTLETASYAARLADQYANLDRLLFLGRGIGYPTALEGALKMKEISYVQAEGYAAGELKHGPLALVEPGSLIVVVATRSATLDKVLSNIEEVRARGGRILAIVTEGDTSIDGHADEVIRVPATPELLSPLVNSIPLQLFAYYVAVARGCDVDKPRNLAKSVTVE